MKTPDRPLRVTMVNKYYSPPHLGGVETVVRTLSEGLVEHAGACVRALVSNESRACVEETIGGVDVVRLPRQLALSSAPVAAGMPGALRAEMCRVVPFGLPAQRLTATPAVLRRAAELRAARAGRQIVLFVGRLVYYKGVDVLVQAMAGVDADLVLIGRGPLEAELREFVCASGIVPRVTFLAPQGDDELSAWYHAADVFCLPSVARSEAFGLVQIEAHAAGTPVVSTDLPTGVPAACASICTRPKASLRATLGRQNTSAA